MVGGMSVPVGPSRGSQLLEQWLGDRLHEDARKVLGLDPATFSRFLNGVRRPVFDVAFDIEERTGGIVYAKSWREPPKGKRKARAA
jgi:hypothetical protein